MYVFTYVHSICICLYPVPAHILYCSRLQWFFVLALSHFCPCLAHRIPEDALLQINFEELPLEVLQEVEVLLFVFLGSLLSLHAVKWFMEVSIHVVYLFHELISCVSTQQHMYSTYVLMYIVRTYVRMFMCMCIYVHTVFYRVCHTCV